ncbi:secretion/DNA translocation related TadE-like protein [Okibacterium sp. HSC-33S16]|uniref:Rv3654c family TadE-like protein n=1 Tax=Okibacterium sp. HSC-33S16 TaxID=2910965 RepID=UPI00209D4F7B|nr:Rv3654c family TadE-like protein [Okibacterium sp. HSC-33S16]MCP2032221.1 secretion/DNA translocation related TadE-like protein [Okibacterium sp. HSC-33S16]
MNASLVSTRDRGPEAHSEAKKEEGSGSVLAVALAASILALTGLALPLNQALTVRQLVANAADAAALAAADTASGVAVGYPCANAAVAARLNGAELGECVVDGLKVRVTAVRRVLGVPVTVVAVAGPPATEPLAG